MAQYFEYAFVEYDCSSRQSLSYSMYLRNGNENTLDDEYYLQYNRQFCIFPRLMLISKLSYEVRSNCRWHNVSWRRLGRIYGCYAIVMKYFELGLLNAI